MELGSFGLRPFPALRPPKQAFMLNQRMNGDWVFPVEESTRIRALITQGPAKGLCVKELEIPFTLGHLA